MGVLATELWGYSRRHGGAHIRPKTRTRCSNRSGDFEGDFGVGYSTRSEASLPRFPGSQVSRSRPIILFVGLVMVQI